MECPLKPCYSHGWSNFHRGTTMTIKLYKFGEGWDVPDPSPFCVKLESFLRYAGISYQPVPFDPKTAFSLAPKGKLPFVQLENGRMMGDSTMIISHLSRERGIDLDAPLSEYQCATSHAMRRMLDESTYWVALYSRWFDDANWPRVRDAFFAPVPAPLRGIISGMQRKKVWKSIHGHGYGRHSRDEIYGIGCRDMEALSVLLGRDGWFFGAVKPTLLDLWAHAFVVNIVKVPFGSPLKDFTLRKDNLVAHAERLHTLIYEGGQHQQQRKAG